VLFRWRVVTRSRLLLVAVPLGGAQPGGGGTGWTAAGLPSAVRPAGPAPLGLGCCRRSTSAEPAAVHPFRRLLGCATRAAPPRRSGTGVTTSTEQHLPILSNLPCLLSTTPPLSNQTPPPAHEHSWADKLHRQSAAEGAEKF